MNCSTCGFVVKYQNRSPVENILARVSTRKRTGSWIPSRTRSTAIVMKTRVSMHSKQTMAVQLKVLFPEPNSPNVSTDLHSHQRTAVSQTTAYIAIPWTWANTSCRVPVYSPAFAAIHCTAVTTQRGMARLS